MRVVVALGGNALLRRGEPLSMAAQRANAQLAAAAIAEVAAAHEVIVTHGNGPQVGLLALEAAGYDPSCPVPLDVLGAESQGMIGYLLESALRNALPGQEVASLLTQVIVDRADPAFALPTKPIGPIYSEEDARALAASRGWTVSADGGGFRRVVASPDPLRIVESPAIALLVRAGVLVVAAGGGGVPVALDGNGREQGCEAVVDKDLTANLLAIQLEADALLLLTDVPAVSDGWPPAGAPAVRTASVPWFRARRWAAGSMAPKLEAGCRFVDATNGLAAIGSLQDAAAILRGDAGTRITRDGPATFWN